MPLRECRECGHPVQTGEAACPHCGAPVRHRTSLLVVGLAVLGLGATVAVFLAMFQPGKVPRRADPSLSPQQALQARVDQLLTDGVVTKVQDHAVWVEAVIWNLKDEADRVAIASTCGTYAGMKDGSNKQWCEIRDNRTGKAIAGWTQAAGLMPAEP